MASTGPPPCLCPCSLFFLVFPSSSLPILFPFPNPFHLPNFSQKGASYRKPALISWWSVLSLPFEPGTVEPDPSHGVRYSLPHVGVVGVLVTALPAQSLRAPLRHRNSELGSPVPSLGPERDFWACSVSRPQAPQQHLTQERIQRGAKWACGVSCAVRGPFLDPRLPFPPIQLAERDALEMTPKSDDGESYFVWTLFCIAKIFFTMLLLFHKSIQLFPVLKKTKALCEMVAFPILADQGGSLHVPSCPGLPGLSPQGFSETRGLLDTRLSPELEERQ